jgi:hypothetical protein
MLLAHVPPPEITEQRGSFAAAGAVVWGIFLWRDRPSTATPVSERNLVLGVLIEPEATRSRASGFTSDAGSVSPGPVRENG